MDAEQALELWQRRGTIDAELAIRLRADLDQHRLAAELESSTPARASAPAPTPARASAPTPTSSQARVEETEPWSIRILVMVGAVLVGGGLLAFIGGQWDQQSPVRRIALLMLVWALVVGAAAALTRQGMAVTGRAFWFLSVLAIGVNLFLVGQIFNLPLNWWQGTALWAIAAIAMGWATGGAALGWLAVPLGVLTLAWLVPPQTRWAEQFAILFEPQGMRALLPVVGLTLIVAARMIRPDGDFGFLWPAANVFGAALVAIPVVVSTFHPVVFAWVFGIDVGWRHIVLVVIAVAVVAAGAMRHPNPLIVGSAVAMAVLMAVTLPQIDGARLGSDLGVGGDSVPWLSGVFDSAEWTFWLWNMVILGLAVAVAIVGRHFGEVVLVNVGLAAVAVLILAFYIGRIAGELPTSLALLGGGLVLIAGGYWLERRRRDLVRAVAT